MRNSPLNWPELLSSYPGQSLGEKIIAAKGNRTFQELAEELRQGADTLKAFFYRAINVYPEIRINHEARRSHPDYAGILGIVISALAEEMGVTESEYRDWIKTEEGRKEFKYRCHRLKISLFECHKCRKKS